MFEDVYKETLSMLSVYHSLPGVLGLSEFQTSALAKSSSK